MDISKLLPGDVLLYAPTSIFGTIISIKTWHRISHVEVYIGTSLSVAARDGIGVNSYPIRTDHIVTVLRPKVPFSLSAALDWFESVKGKPYGWWDLINFVGISVNTNGMFCSEFATLFLRAGGVPIFCDREPACDVAPFEFELSELLMPVTV